MMKHSDSIEIEAKFSAPDAASLSRLLDLEQLDEYRLSDAKEVQVTDRYFDTPEETLRAQGYVCRVRESPGSAQLALKSRGDFEDGVHRREEIESPIPRGLEPVKWPDCAARKAILKLVDLDSMRPIATLLQNRKVRKLRKGKTVSAELSLDEVTPIGHNGGTKLYEVEVELSKKGVERDLQRIAAVLEPLGLKPQRSSKLERLLRPRAANPKQASPDRSSKSPKAKKGLILDPDQTMEQAGLGAIRFHSKRLVKLEKEIRKGKDIEDLHGMRVATRRLRAAVKLFGDHLPEKPLKKLTSGLSVAGKALGKARDYDVLLVNLDRYKKETPSEVHKGLRPLTLHWRKQGEEARAELLEFLNSADYTRLKRVCKKFSRLKQTKDKEVAEEGKAEPSLLRYAIPRLLWEEYESVRCYEPVLKDAPVETFHALRIECKRLRYSLEFFKDLLGSQGAALIEAVVAAQEHLGVMQDAEVAEKLLDALLQQYAKWTKKTRRAVEGYRNACRARKIDQINRFGEVWKKLVGERFRKNLADAVSSL